MRYRPEIDGLRAIAVVPVLLFHAGFTAFKGGFVGVDVFFVISGYLITSIIYSDIKSNSFSIVQFYERRVRRILPALFLVSLICIPIALLLMLPDEFKAFSKSLAAVQIFSSNILFWQESGYFESGAELKPLLHTWSIAVEEQFYLFFPLFLLLFRKLKTRGLTGLLLGVTLLSLGLAEYTSGHDSSANFYLLPSRAWELSIGAILAISLPLHKEANPSFSAWASLLGLAMIIYSVFTMNKNVPFPSILTLIPVSGAALIIAYGKPTNFTGKILCWKPICGLGLISYSTYLWHQPLFAFARLREGVLSPEKYFILIFISVTLAYFSWRFVELPFRNRKNFNRKKIFSGAAILSVAMITFGIAGYFHSDDLIILNDEHSRILSYLHYDRSEPYREGSCFLREEQSFGEFEQQCFSSGDTMIWGDSHAAALSYGLKNRLGELTQITASACPPFKDYIKSSRPHCSDINDFALEIIDVLQPGLIFLHANWIAYDFQGDLEKFISATVQSVLQASPKSRIVLVGGVPQWEPSLPVQLIKNGIKLQDMSFLRSEGYSKILRQDMTLKAVAKANHIDFISILDLFCKNGECLSSVRDHKDYEPFAWDSCHLTKSASLQVSEKILQKLKPPRYPQ